MRRVAVAFVLLLMAPAASAQAIQFPSGLGVAHDMGNNVTATLSNFTATTVNLFPSRMVVDGGGFEVNTTDPVNVKFNQYDTTSGQTLIRYNATADKGTATFHHTGLSCPVTVRVDGIIKTFSRDNCANINFTISSWSTHEVTVISGAPSLSASIISKGLGAVISWFNVAFNIPLDMVPTVLWLIITTIFTIFAVAVGSTGAAIVTAILLMFIGWAGGAIPDVVMLLFALLAVGVVITFTRRVWAGGD